VAQFDGNDPYINNLEELEFEEYVNILDEEQAGVQVGVDESVEDVTDEGIEVVTDEGIQAGYDNKNKPYIGLEFRTPEEAYNFYNNYACHVGFSVRKATRAKNSQGVSSIRYVCNKEGFSKYQKKKEMPIGSLTGQKTPEKVKGITRVGCKASIRIKLVQGGIWQVSVFVEDHNHDLIASPSKKRNLRSQKRLTNEDRDIIRNLSSQNVGTSQILEYLAIEHGGKEHLRFKKKRCEQSDCSR
jgi:FAR1 DNA-binding domain